MSAAGRPYSTPPDIPGMQFVQPLGKGGYADVFLYEQQMPRMKVAVKVLMAEGLTDAVRRQFTAEGNAMAELADHPYIVQVFRAGIADDGRPYLLMKYYPLPNLGVRSRREQIPVSEVVSIGIDICSAVETAHRAGILHRDIKPANILTGQYGAPGLTDFGIAATKASAAQTDPEGMSIPWSPPEVLFATSPADERSDVYAMAATLRHLLVGRSPFEVVGGDNSSLALMRRIRAVPAPRTGRPDVPASLERLLQQAMAKDPTLRPRSALDLARALQGVEQEHGLPLTKIVVSADVLDQNYATDDTEDATRVRAPVQISAQRIAQPRSSQRTPSPAPPVPPPDFGLARQHPLHPAWLVAGVAALAAVGIVIGVAVTSGRNKNPKTQQTVSGQPSDTDALIVPPPGQPMVTVRRLDPNHVRFSWTYDNALGDDSFKYLVKPSGGGTSTKPTVDLPTGPKQKLCLSIVVYRNSGASMSDPSAEVCSP